MERTVMREGGKVQAPPVVVVTGTDTGVGKSVVTALLTYGLRRRGFAVRAVKPISTGDRNDGRLLACAQGGDVRLAQVNPFHFTRPIAPLCAARMAGKPMRLSSVLSFLGRTYAQAEGLLVEGAGGWRTPLGEGFDLGDVCSGLGSVRARVVVVVANRLGALHQALCVVESVEARLRIPPVVVLTNTEMVDGASRRNAAVLRELLPRRDVIEWPFCGRVEASPMWLTRAEKMCKKSLASLALAVSFSPAFRGRSVSRKKSGKSC